ncbi:MAG TPA: hypothetical protein VFA94_07450 [Acidimicrobiales bacterium]|nr:hypothetical protein [Acidimicrobiales bacterium]
MSHRALAAAVWLSAGEALGIMAVLALRGSRTAPFFAACLAVKLPFCWALSRRHPGAWLAILLWELTGVLAALVAPGLPIVLRGAELAVAGTVIALLASSLPSFPHVELPHQ